jgi:hypothetical protein
LTKGILESTFMLITAAHLYVADDRRLPPAGYANHPLHRWTGNNCHNYGWVADYRKAALEEYHRRHDRRHPLEMYTQLLDEMWFKLPFTPLEPFLNFAHSDRHRIDFRHLDVPYSYRNYLNVRWSRCKPVWTRATPPLWRTA